MFITIKSIDLKNFKGIRNLKVDFGHITNISGDNGTGKTSVFDAFTWTMFGKNSEDAKDFNVKTLGPDNQPIHKLEHQVTVLLNIDGKDMAFRKMLKEKWVKKRGEETSEFTGHETSYFVDDVPLQQKEYQARVDFVMNESIAKMITNPLYFNAIKWNDRRGVLEAMAGHMDNTEIAAGNKAFIDLLAQIGGESIIDFKKKLASKRGLIKQNLEGIPTRINEAQRNKPEVLDYLHIQKQIDAKQKEIAEIESAMEDRTKAYELEYNAIQKKQGELNNLKTELQKAEQLNLSSKTIKLAEQKVNIEGQERELRNAQSDLAETEKEITAAKAKVERLTVETDSLRKEWTAENGKTLTIDAHALECPACQQSLPEERQDEIRQNLESNFNSAKSKKLAELDITGSANKKAIAEANEKVGTLTTEKEGLQQRIANLEKSIEQLKAERQETESAPVPESKEVKTLKEQIAAFVIPTSPTIDQEDLKARKKTLAEEVNGLNLQLGTKETIEKTDARIAELEAEEKKLSQELASLERMEFTIAEFSKAKVEAIESRINGKFKLVRFKMFDTQINGGEAECCECMVDGVPYADLNTASKINAGIDIINALCEHYKINAPVFIDNRESVINLLPCNSQIINLRAVKDAPLTATIETPTPAPSH